MNFNWIEKGIGYAYVNDSIGNGTVELLETGLWRWQVQLNDQSQQILLNMDEWWGVARSKFDAIREVELILLGNKIIKVKKITHV